MSFESAWSFRMCGVNGRPSEVRISQFSARRIHYYGLNAVKNEPAVHLPEDFNRHSSPSDTDHEQAI